MKIRNVRRNNEHESLTKVQELMNLAKERAKKAHRSRPNGPDGSGAPSMEDQLFGNQELNIK